MGYQYSGDDLFDLKESIIKSLDKLDGLSATLKTKAQTAFQDPSWSGQTAEKYNDYYVKVYVSTADELSALNSRLKSCLNIYYANYAGYVDNDKHAVIYTAETDQLCEDLQGKGTIASDIHSSVKQEIRNVNGITGWISYWNPGIEECINTIIQTISDMYDRINNTEIQFATDLGEFSTSCTTLNQLIDAGLAVTVSGNGKSIDFNAQTITEAADAVNQDTVDQNHWQADNADIITAAEEFGEQDKAARKREKEAATVKVIVGVACAVGSIALTVATGGAFAAVVIGGVAAGAVTGAVNCGADQYAANGWNNFDWGEVGKSAVIGGAVGGATSMVGYGLSSVVSSAAGCMPVVQAGIRSASQTTQMVTYGAVGAGSSVVSGIGSRAVGSVAYQLATTGTVDFETVKENTFSVSSIIVDGAIGGVSGAYTGYRHANEVGSPRVPEEYAKHDASGNVVKNSHNQNDPNWQTLPDGSQSDGYVIDLKTGKDIKSSTDIHKGKVVQRYGPDYGAYMTEPGTSVEECALPYVKKDLYKHTYKFIKDAPGECGTIGQQPAFGSQGAGGGTQYRVTFDGGKSFQSIDALMKNGYLIELPKGYYGNTMYDTNAVMQGQNVTQGNLGDTYDSGNAFLGQESQ